MMSTADQATAQFWDKIADGYVKSKISDMAAYEYTLDRTASYLTGTDRVLELGCGTGMTAAHLAPHVASFTASDVSEEMLKHGRQRAAEGGHDNLQFVRAMVGDKTFEGQRFDVVLAHSLLHLLPDLEQRLADIHALLPAGGLLISKTACLAEGRSIRARAIRTAIPVMQWMGKAPFVNSLSIADLEGLMVNAGFKIIESGNFPNKVPPARYLVAKKM